MLEYTNFQEMFDDYNKGLVPFCILEETARAVIFMCDLPVESFENLEKLSIKEIEDIAKDLETSDYSFEMGLGGNIHLCETSADLLQVKCSNLEWEEEHGTMPNVTTPNLPIAWDDCNYVNQDIETGWAVFLLCTNNAGGPLYYIPKKLWKEARVEEHIFYNSY